MRKLVLLSTLAVLALAGCGMQTTTPVACTEEAKICPDGSAVGRTGANCEFAACPEASGGKEVFCTMDAKICPDGSAVGRTSPNCEFAKCPGE